MNSPKQQSFTTITYLSAISFAMASCSLAKINNSLKLKKEVQLQQIKKA
jgi:hypothetical protein